MSEAAQASSIACAHALGKPAFPIYQHHPDLHYLDTAATAHKPRAVIDAMTEHYERYSAPVHRGLYTLAAEASVRYESARADVARFINARLPQECVFTGGATESINVVAQSWARPRLRAGDEVWVSDMEHHSNYLPWERVCRETGASLRSLRVSAQGELLVNEEELFASSVKLIALTHVSNVSGRVNPVERIASRALEYGIPVLIDACQAVGHIPVDVQELGCAFMAFSAHKMYGPEGIGVLYGQQAYLEQCEPQLVGGGMVDKVACPDAIGTCTQSSTWAPLPARLEAGSPNLSGAVGFSAAIQCLEQVGVSVLQVHCEALAKQAREWLGAVDEISLVGCAADGHCLPGEYVGIVSFVVKGVHPHDVAQIAADNGVAIRAGHHCAQPLMHALGVSSTVRASLGAYTTTSDVVALVQAVEQAISVFRR